MRIHIFILISATLSILVESSAWSLSNIMMSGSKASMMYTDSVLVAVEKGMEECRHQFRWHTWGCPKSSFNIFSKTYKEQATKEMAFLHAMISSSIVVTLTRNCSMGQFDKCGCADTSKLGYDGWAWGGCSDNVKIGFRMAKNFLDAKEIGRDVKALINLHNNKVGRIAVKKTMIKECKCHGVSGSCETQTCWMRIKDLRHIGDQLKKSYDTSASFDTNRYGKVQPFNSLRRDIDNSVHQQQANKRNQLGIPRNHLVYLEESPNYCAANASAGIPGTIGRECSRSTSTNVTLQERSSCKSLCRECGRRVKKRTLVLQNNCKCKFYWCCKVKCKTCINQVVQYVCV